MSLKLTRNRHPETSGSGFTTPPRDLYSFAHSTELAIIFIDHEGRITFVNHATELLFGHTRRDMLGQGLDMIIPERLRAAHHAGVERIKAGLPSKLAGRTVEIAALCADGREVPVEISMSAWQGPDGLMMGGIIRDVSDRRERDMRLARFARHDPLTGLPNRRVLLEHLQSMLDAGIDVTVILVTLDDLKKVNGDLGYKAGDTILQSLAIRLPGLLPKSATLYRVEGSLFAATLPELGDPVHAAGLARELIGAVRAPFNLGDHVVRLHSNAGIAIGPSQATDAEELIACADLALERKRRPGGLVRLFQPAMRGGTAARRAMNDEIRQAVRFGELELYYQPQVDLASGAVIGAEALLRWNHPMRGLLAPAAFLSALENHSLSGEVGNWIIDQACSEVAQWRSGPLPSARVAVNLFAGQLTEGNLPDIAHSALRRHNLPPEALELEVTETTVLGIGDGLEEQFRALREAKVRIAFDDFGTGHASLSMLKRFPATTLKIDQSFVRGLGHDKFDLAIVRSLLDMSRMMGLDVIVEGIETTEQRDRLIEIGCRFGQGSLFARPLQAGRFMQYCQGSRQSLRSA